MRQIIRRTAPTVAVASTALGFGAWSADILTCPGEVETTGSEVPITYCDENPEHDNLFNSPGTPEQKVATFSMVLAGASVTVVLTGSRRQTKEVASVAAVAEPEPVSSGMKERGINCSKDVDVCGLGRSLMQAYGAVFYGGECGSCEKFEQGKFVGNQAMAVVVEGVPQPEPADQAISDLVAQGFEIQHIM